MNSCRNIPELIEFFSPESVQHPEFDRNIRTVLDTINQRVNARESLDDVMHYVFDTTREFYPCDRIGLAFLEESDQRVTARWAMSLYDPMLLKTGYSEDLSGSSLEYILQTGHSRIIHDLQEYALRFPNSRASRILVKEGVRSSLTCPLYVDGRIVGLFFRSSRKPNAYSAVEVAKHLAIADRLAQTIEKTYRIDLLSNAIKAYMEVLGFVSHELKSPVASIEMDSRMLLDGYYGPLSEKQQKKIERIVVRCDHLLGLVREYLDLARMESGSMSLNITEETDVITEVVRPSMDIIQPQAENRHMTIRNHLPETLIMSCDRELLKIVVINLLSNAVKYGNENGRIDLSGSLDEYSVTMSVRNEGPGFPESEKSRLFKRFSRINTPELMKRKGTGVGLYTVWQIIQLHRGRISAESEQGQWAEFTFTIPRNAGSFTD